MDRRALRWGLVAVAAMALFVMRGCLTLRDDLRELRGMVKTSDLLDRMSQLKPALWKGTSEAVLLILFFAVLIGTVVMVWIAAWRAFRERS